MNIAFLANYIIGKYGDEYQDITPLKLQKLLYYVKVWTLVDEDPKIKENFYSWKHGPVNTEIYHMYKKHKSEPIFDYDKETYSNSFSGKKTIAFILENYLEFDAISLSVMSHNELPWKNTPENCPIEDSLILDYYKKLPFAMNFPFSPNNTFYSLVSNVSHSFFLDMTNFDAEEIATFSSYSDYKRLKKEAKENAEGIVNRFLPQERD
jgi:uncharacterized phage-associated protein